MPAGPSDAARRLRRLTPSVLSTAGGLDPRAYRWTDATLDRFVAGLGLGTDRDAAARPPTLVDLGCGWGALGLLLALRVPRLRVIGVDLDEDALALGRDVARAAGLGRRVELVAGDAVDDDARLAADALVCQALLVHTPRPAAWLERALAGVRAGVAVGVVEVDAVARAEGIRDGVTDGDIGYAAARRALAAAVARGARATLSVDRRLGPARLAELLRGAGLASVHAEPLADGTTLAPPYGADEPRARWFDARLRRRIDEGLDPVERSLAEAGGLGTTEAEQFASRRTAADRHRRRALAGGRLRRDEGAGVAVGWGRVSRAAR